MDFTQTEPRIPKNGYWMTLIGFQIQPNCEVDFRNLDSGFMKLGAEFQPQDPVFQTEK